MAGRILASSSTIARSLRFDGSQLSNAGNSAIFIESSVIGGDFVFREVAVAGGIYLGGTKVETLIDDPESWAGTAGQVTLDGFTYRRFSGRSPTDAERRITWLRLQRAEHLGDSFRSQPWEQLSLVLRSMGHPAAARRIAAGKQDALRTAGKIPKAARPFHWIYGKLTGFGYQPIRLAGALLVAWLAGTLVYSLAANPPRWFSPNLDLIAPGKSSPDWVCIEIHARRGDPSPCPPQTPSPDRFVAPIYALDALLPVASLGYRSDWKPQLDQPNRTRRMLAWGLQGFTWLLTLLGWMFGLLLVGVLGNLIKKD